MTTSFVLFEMMNPMLLMAKEAKARGMRIVVLNHDPLRDSGPFAVPEGFVDELIHIASWSDADAVETVLKDVHARHDVAGTYAGFEPTLPYEAMLREWVGLPNNGAANIRRVLDKRDLRARLYSEGLTGLRSASLNEALTWTEWPFDAAAVLKPANGTGSALCFIVSSLDELRAAVGTIDQVTVANPLMDDYIHAKGDFVLEAEAKGELLSVESVVYRGDVRPIGLMGRYVLAKDPVVEMGFQFPYPHPRAAEIFAKTKELHRSLGYHNGATQMEVMVPAEGPIELIDFNPRLAGTASIILFSEAYAMRYEQILTDLGCGLAPNLDFIGSPRRYAAEMLLLPQPGVTRLDSIEFPDDTFCHRLPKKPGTVLGRRADQLDCVGMFVTTADSPSELHVKGLEARRRTVVNGKPLGDNENNVLAWSPYIGQDLAGDGMAATTGQEHTA